MVASMTLLTAMEYLCHKLPRYVILNTSGAGTAYPSEAPAFTSVFSGISVARSLVFLVVFCGLLSVL